ncbi:TRAP transporter substrate-binding protein [Aestuariibius insulae]|uniref:TRAP transporter substrate-binding protein n=1 Tax=Aestuariibius insulae TaxID=2058287 RepID=UPI00345E0F0D
MKTWIAAAAGMMLSAGGALAQAWDMPTPYGDATFHTQNIAQFADDLREATDGALDITVHSAGSLFPHAEIKNAVRSRQVPIGEFLLSRLSNEDAAYGLDTQPFLATSYEQAQKLWEAQKPVITELLAEEGLMPLFSVPWPAQGLYTNGEIAGVDGLGGLRFRAYNASLEEFAQIVGAAPVQVEAPDIPQAFSTGQVEAMITSPSTGANSSAWDFVSHFSPINAWLPKNIVVVNQRVFDGLDEATQAAVMDAAAAAEQRGWEMSATEAEEKTAVLAENGVEVYAPSDALMAELLDVGTQMLETWEDAASDQAKSILTGYQSN